MHATPCPHCTARQVAPLHPLYSPKCLACGGLLIHRIGLLGKRRGDTPPRPRAEIVERRRKVLADWMAWGHSEAAIRAEAKQHGP